MNQYIEIWYTYKGNDAFFPPIAIVELEAESGKLIIEDLAIKALEKIKEKYPEKTIIMLDYHYLGHTVEIIK